MASIRSTRAQFVALGLFVFAHSTAWAQQPAGATQPTPAVAPVAAPSGAAVEPAVQQTAPRAPAAAPASLRLARRSLSVLDWSVIGAYAVAMIGIGVYYSRVSKSTEDYVLGGRNMRSSSIGLSLFATLISTITYLAMPGEMIRYGPIVLIYLIVLPLVYPIVGYLLIPYFMKLPVTSAYEILEGKLGLSSRLLASGFFLITRLVWMALIVFATARMLADMLGWSHSVIPWIALVMSAVTIVYTWMGGIRAVVLTDVIQSYILFGGAILTVVLVTVSMGGFGAWWPTQWEAHWPEATWFSVKPGVRTTVIGSVIWMFTWWICTAGSDQMAIQRYLATRDANAARKAFLVTLLANLLTNLTLGLVGFALLAYFKANPLPPGAPSFTNKSADSIFPFYIVNYLPTGVAGLVVAGVLAAAMSSLSGGINSASSVFTRDFVERFRKGGGAAAARIGLDEGGSSFGLVKALSLVIGLIALGASLFMDRIPGNLVEVTTRTNHLFVAPIFGLFFFAMFVPFATPIGAVSGSVAGIIAAVIIGYWDVLTGQPAISFQYISLVAFIVNVVVGVAVSLITPRKTEARFPAADLK